MLPTGWLRKLFGDRGETAAVRYLQQQGYRILARQSRSFVGEIDIIATKADRIIFVEVKTRSSHVAGHPTEAVNKTKQTQIARAALVWLKRHRLLNRGCRFDVIAITWRPAASPIIEHYAAAFEPPIDW